MNFSFFKLLSFFIFISQFYSCIFVIDPVIDPVCIKEGTKYGRTNNIFTGEWYEYYSRALSYIEGECYEFAIDDLEEAIKRQNKDRIWASTYGMHYIDYFPHRELGFVHFIMGDYDAAKYELLQSIDQEPSEKAYHYLDNVRQKIMIREKQPASYASIRLDSDYIVTNDDSVVISGSIEDKQFIKEFLINDNKIFLEYSKKKISFRESYKLLDGKQEMTITVRNLMGGETKKKLFIHVDRKGPVVTITKYTPGAEIAGYLIDEFGGLSCFLNGEPIPLSKAKKAFFSIQLKTGIKNIKLIARDKLGNETLAIIDSSLASFKTNAAMYANYQNNIATDAASISPDTNKSPQITLYGWPDFEKVWIERINIQVKVTVKSKTDIKTIFINDQPVLLSNDKLCDAGKDIFFSHSILLKPGENTIQVRAISETGETDLKKITIIREIPEIFQPQNLFPISIKAFNEDIENSISYQLQNFVINEFLLKGRFQIVNTKIISKIKKQSIFSRIIKYLSENIQNNNFLYRNNLKNAKALIEGNFFITRSGIEIIAKMVDLQTREILAIKNVYCENKGTDSFKILANRLVLKFHKEFPQIDSEISELLSDEQFVVKSTKVAVLKIKRPLCVYRYITPKYNPVTGLFLGANTQIIGSANVVKIQVDGYVGQLKNKHILTLKDRVINLL